MNLAEMIGKVVIRTEPAKHGDPSFQTEPIEILSYQNGKMECCFFDYTGQMPDYITDNVFELDERWQDGKWKLFDFNNCLFK
ncbi:MAG: hypothetical protein WCR33_04095 [Bacilli bacterium]|jgi:hypothetical protein